MADAQEALESPLFRRAYPPDAAEGLFRLCEEREIFLVALEQLPQTLCHMDAFKRNLFSRHSTTGDYEAIGVDWAFTGRGAVGEEIVPLVMASAAFMDVDMSDLPELDAIVFDGYLQGLRQAGWQGDARLARLGYAAASPLRYGFGARFWVETARDESRQARFERAIGMPIEAWADSFGVWNRFLVARAEEARGLLGIL
jgi:hypothetical protein